VQVADILGDDRTLGVLPGAGADPVARVDRSRALRTEIGVPRLATRAGGLRERLTLLVGAFEAAEVPTLSRASTGDEERHVRLLRVGEAASTEGQ
jgi:hypothetical protein